MLSGRIDVNEVNSRLAPYRLPADSFLKYCTFQTFFAGFLNSAIPGTFVPCEELVSRSKLLLQSQSSCVLLLDGWVHCFHMVPLKIPHLEKIFHHILVVCKITKFKEVNYKILSRILLMLKLLSRIVTKPELQWCVWCGVEASLEYILLTYPSTIDLYLLVIKIAFHDHTITSKSWILGITCQEKNPIIWLTNFTIYKCHLKACNGCLWTCKHNSYQSVHDIKSYTLLYLFSVSAILVEADLLMETTHTPLHLDGTQCFLPDQATATCYRMLPEWNFDTSPTLVGAIA